MKNSVGEVELEETRGGEGSGRFSDTVRKKCRSEFHVGAIEKNKKKIFLNTLETMHHSHSIQKTRVIFKLVCLDGLDFCNYGLSLG